MKPGPVAKHLGRPPSRVPLCSDSGPLCSRVAGLKVELPETLPSPLPPAASSTGSHGPSCAVPGWPLVVSPWLEAGGWQSERRPPGSQLGWEGEEGSCQDGLPKLMELSEEKTGPPTGQTDPFTISPPPNMPLGFRAGTSDVVCSFCLYFTVPYTHSWWKGIGILRCNLKPDGVGIRGRDK